MQDMATVFNTFPVLETERCTLRAVTPDDAPAIFHIWNDARVTRYIGRPPMVSMDEALKRVDVFRTTFEEQTGVCWAIDHGGQVVGTFVFWNLEKEHFRAEIGYVLAPEWWGKGLMIEVARAALRFGFTDMGLHRIEAQVDPENAASRRVVEKLGFVQEGHFRDYYYDPVEARFTGNAVFALLKPSWLRRTEADAGGLRGVPPEAEF